MNTNKFYLFGMIPILFWASFFFGTARAEGIPNDWNRQNFSRSGSRDGGNFLVESKKSIIHIHGNSGLLQRAWIGAGLMGPAVDKKRDNLKVDLLSFNGKGEYAAEFWVFQPIANRGMLVTLDGSTGMWLFYPEAPGGEPELLVGPGEVNLPVRLSMEVENGKLKIYLDGRLISSKELTVLSEEIRFFVGASVKTVGDEVDVLIKMEKQ